MNEFTNLGKAGVSFNEYSLMLGKFSKYASSFVSNDRDEISHYATGAYGGLKKECRATILHEDMDLSWLNFHAQLVVENRLRMKNREAKKERSFQIGSSNNRLEFKTRLN